MRALIVIPCVLVLAGLLVLLAPSTDDPERDQAPSTETAAQWVDEAQCGQCHQQQMKDWRDSHHHQAMRLPSDDTVRGDFSGDGFFRKDDGFWVGEHKVAYTFGWEPLQQYLLETEGGRLQAYGIAWDTRRQAWFDLYQDEDVDQAHRLHWRQPSQNANFMCVECHVSDFQRNYDAGQDRFDSDWRALGVGCQSCHGPASNHLEWTDDQDQRREGRGFEQPLTDAARASQVETCARCHSRRSPLGDGHAHGNRLRDDYRVTGLSEELYEVDGTIDAEVFEYGAFAQSRMYAAGVVCSDCHNAHSGELRAPGNQVCTQCHNGEGAPTRPAIRADNLRPGDYDSPEHHHHADGSPGAQCQACHMPGKIYMGNDRRHDHGFTSPDPAQARALGHDDACLGCHADQEPQALIEQFQVWFPDHRPRDGGYARALFKARHGEAGAAAAVFEQLDRDDLPALRRAALLAELPSYPSARARQALRAAGRSPSDAVREAAAQTLPALLEPGEVEAALRPLLNDPVRSVRLEAAWQRLLVAGPQRGTPPEWIDEYEAVQRGLRERADAHFNLANLYQLTGRPERVEPALREALRRDQNFFPAMVLRAQWLEQYAGEPERARTMLRDSLARHPQEASLHHALGLSLVRAGRYRAALAALQEAHRWAPDNSEYTYVLAVALHDIGEPERALSLLREQVRAHPANRSLRMTLLGFLGRKPQASAEIQALLDGLRRQNPWDPALPRR